MKAHLRQRERTARRLAGSVVALVIGLLLFLPAEPLWRLPGLVAVVCGASMLGLEASRFTNQFLARRERERREAARRVLKAIRRERQAQERDRTAHKKETAAKAAALQKAAQNEQREKLRREQEETALRLREHEGRLHAEAERLLDCSEGELRQEILALFAKRKFAAASLPKTANVLRLTEANGGEIHLALLLPQGRQAGVADIQELESLRRDNHASHAYLIALAGFTVPAVRLVRHLPVTLVEAHLLAQWGDGETQANARVAS